MRFVLELRIGTAQDADDAVAVWRAAQGARGRRPNGARVARVLDKLSARGALLVVAELEDADAVAQVVGFALGEPGRVGAGAGAGHGRGDPNRDGDGCSNSDRNRNRNSDPNRDGYRDRDGDSELEPGLLHLSMLFVLPAHQRRGVGSALLEGIADAAWLPGYRRLQVWTRADNTDARGLYEACGLELSGREQDLDGPAVQYVAELEPPVRDLLIRSDGLRLGQLLKLAGLVETGAQGKELLAAGLVQVDGEVELRRGRQLTDGEVVTARDQSVRLVLPDPDAAHADHADPDHADADHADADRAHPDRANEDHDHADRAHEDHDHPDHTHQHL